MGSAANRICAKNFFPNISEEDARTENRRSTYR
jgi:hypothetical protein